MSTADPVPDSSPAIVAPTDYAASAELFAVQKLGRKRNLYYQRFDTAAEAMRFAIEEMPEGSANIVLETEFARYDATAIAKHYAADAYPLPRRAAP